MGGARCGGGCRCGGPVGYIFVLGNRGIHFLYWRYVGEKLSQIFSNFLKFALFCKILQKISGAPDAAGLSDTFLVLEILVEKKLSQIISFFLKFSQIFSEYIFMYWQWRKIISNYLFFSQIFSKFLKFSQIISKFLICLFQIVSIFSTKYLPQMMGSRSGGGYR